MGTEQLTDRSALRRFYQQKRLQIPVTLWQWQSQLICDYIASWQIFQDALVIFSFVAHQKEPDLAYLSTQFPSKTWALPRCHQNQIQFHPITPQTPLIPNPWGILEPPPHAPIIVPDRSSLCLVPGIVFDRRGYRLGFGKGYYDRFFALYPHCCKVGILFPEFLIDHTYPQPWDIKMDYLVHNGTIEPVQN